MILLIHCINISEKNIILTLELWNYLTPDGKIFLPHFKDVHERITAEIIDLFDVRVISNKLENPLIIASLEVEDDDLADLSYFNDQYLIERKVDDVSGFCIELRKKGEKPVRTANEAPIRVEKMRKIEESTSQFRSTLGIRPGIPTAVSSHSGAIRAPSNSWPLHHLLQANKNIRGTRRQVDTSQPVPSPKRKRASKASRSMKTPNKVKCVIKNKRKKTPTFCETPGTKRQRKTPASKLTVPNPLTIKSSQKPSEKSSQESLSILEGFKELSSIITSQNKTNQAILSDILSANRSSASENQLTLSKVVEIAAKNEAMYAKSEANSHATLSKVIDSAAKNEKNIMEMAARNDMTAARSEKNIMKMTARNEKHIRKMAKESTDSAYNLQVFKKVKGYTSDQLMHVKGLLK